MNVWTVTCDFVKGVLTYFVENKITGERRGMFDCQPYAEEMARELNREEEAKLEVKPNIWVYVCDNLIETKKAWMDFMDKNKDSVQIVSDRAMPYVACFYDGRRVCYMSRVCFERRFNRGAGISEPFFYDGKIWKSGEVIRSDAV